jgi:hypothetical protein
MTRRQLPTRVVVIGWVAGLLTAGFLLFLIGPQLQCAADSECAWAGERWWYTPLLLAVVVGPGSIATYLRWRSRRSAA